MHSEFFQLFAAYWWLLFPLGWAIAQLVRVWSRHRQADKAMEIIKSYTDQGKEPPPEIIKLLQAPERSYGAGATQQRARERARGLMMASFIFVALCVAFAVLTVSRLHDPDPDTHVGLLFVTVLMGGFAVAFFTAAMLQRRDAKHDDAQGRDGP
jgi:uncharacterized membrane protein YhaH (DUF805 family)